MFLIVLLSLSHWKAFAQSLKLLMYARTCRTIPNLHYYVQCSPKAFRAWLVYVNIFEASWLVMCFFGCSFAIKRCKSDRCCWHLSESVFVLPKGISDPCFVTTLTHTRARVLTRQGHLRVSLRVFSTRDLGGMRSAAWKAEKNFSPHKMEYRVCLVSNWHMFTVCERRSGINTFCT